MEFNKMFPRWLKARGLKSKDVGEKMKKSPQVMSKYVNAEKPNIDFVEDLVQAYPDVDLNELLKNEAVINMLNEEREKYKSQALEALEEFESKIQLIKESLSRK